MLLSFSDLAQEQVKRSIPFSHLHCVRSIKCTFNLKVCANFNFCVYLLDLTDMSAKEYCLPLLIYIVHLLLNVFKKCDELKPGEPSSPTTRKSLLLLLFLFTLFGNNVLVIILLLCFLSLGQPLWYLRSVRLPFNKPVANIHF